MVQHLGALRYTVMASITLELTGILRVYDEQGDMMGEWTYL